MITEQMKHLIGYILIGVPILYVAIVAIRVLWEVVKLLLTCLFPIVFFTIMIVMAAIGLYLLR